jgi:hypothetical protein
MKPLYFYRANPYLSFMNIAKFFEISRLTALPAGIFIAYLVGKGNPETTLHYLSFLVIFILSGLTGVEGVFFGKTSADSMGRQPDSGYQKQSGGANLAFAVTAVLVFVFNWGRLAEVTLLTVTLLFFAFSATFHAREIVAQRNLNVKNMLRPLWTLFLLAACAWPLVKSLY